MIKSILELPVVKNIPLWSSRWSKEALADRERTIGSTPYNRGYRNIAISSDDLMFKHVDDCILYSPNWRDMIMSHLPRYTGVDLSGIKWTTNPEKARKGNAIVTFAYMRNTDKRVITDVQYGPWTPMGTARRIEQVFKLHNPRVIAVEDNGYQVMLAEYLRTAKGGALPIRPFHTTAHNKLQPEEGLPSIEIEFENKQWVIPFAKEHDIDCPCGKCHLVQELRSYPMGESSDALMAMWFAREMFVNHGGGSRGSIRSGKNTEVSSGDIVGEDF